MLATGCTAVSNFGSFHFSSDAGPDPHADAAADGSKPGCSAAPETACDDRKDNDCDGLEDCDDPDCSRELRCCKPNEIPEVSCSGGVDNDCDGLIDCEDSNCAASDACCSASGAEVGPAACADGVDNDCDGLLDCAESACAFRSSCCEAQGEENELTVCTDNVDNDCDGKKDCEDSKCAGFSECCTKSEPLEVSCADAKDNDCDGQVDCRDSDCENRPICKECEPNAASEASCSDLRDNDCDKDRDCWDSDCSADVACCVASGDEQGDAACIDGLDNDCDGAVDCADSECGSSIDCCVASGSESGDSACSDSMDNDCDGITDCDDDGCMGSQHCCVPSGDEVGTLACNDGLDNDCNAEKDCADRKCDSSACCVVSGDEASQPNDGKDNDCNGIVDIALPSATFPPPGQPVAGNEVSVTMVPSVVANAKLECSSRRLANLGTVPVFTQCAESSGTIKPHDGNAAQLASNDGAWVTDVRWSFANGNHSQPFSFRYYIHHTLYKVPRCQSSVSDARWFDLARTRLADTKQFRPGDKTDTALGGPFAHVSYELPNANQITGVNFFQDGTRQTVDMWSLRKRLLLDPDNKLLLVARSYVSSRTGQCNAAQLRFHLHGYMQSYGCDAVVLNRSGAGVCMRNNSGTPVFVHDANDPVTNAIGWAKANKFMWRQLMEAPARGKVHDYKFEENLSYRNFTPKCTTGPCANRNAIFVPDRAFFP